MWVTRLADGCIELPIGDVIEAPPVVETPARRDMAPPYELGEKLGDNMAARPLNRAY